MKHMGTKHLETTRLILRRFQMEDAQTMYQNWVCDKDVTKYLTWPPHSDIDVTKMVLTDWISQYENEDYYQWAIVLKENQEPIGSIGIVKQNDAIHMVHIGYCIGKQWWHQGITSEALSRLIKFFFEEVGMNRIESCHDVHNPNSGYVMNKCGMKFEGTHRQADRNNQGICDICLYGIVADDYKAS